MNKAYPRHIIIKLQKVNYIGSILLHHILLYIASYNNGPFDIRLNCHTYTPNLTYAWSVSCDRLCLTVGDPHHMNRDNDTFTKTPLSSGQCKSSVIGSRFDKRQVKYCGKCASSVACVAFNRPIASIAFSSHRRVSA